jgi:outer membrane protein assembly factor BamB
MSLQLPHHKSVSVLLMSVMGLHRDRADVWTRLSAFASRNWRAVLAFTAASAFGCDATSATDSKARIPEVWVAHIGQRGQFGWGGMPAIAGGHVLVQNESNLVSIAKESGRVMWSTSIKNDPTPGAANIVVAGGLALIGEHYISALDLSTGVVRWRFTPDSLPQSVEASADDRSYYTGQRGIPVVYALELGTGALRWRTNVGATWRYPAYILGVSVSGDTVYVGIEKWGNPSGVPKTAVVVALNRFDGSEFWTYETPDTGHGVQSAPHVYGNLLLIDDFPGGGVLAIDRFTAREVWRWAGPPTAAGPTSPSFISGGVLYVGLGGGYVYALDASSGTILWSHQTKQWVTGITACGGNVFSNVTNIERYDAPSGAVTGHSGNAAALSSVLVTDGVRIYVAGEDGVHAFSCQ